MNVPTFQWKMEKKMKNERSFFISIYFTLKGKLN